MYSNNMKKKGMKTRKPRAAAVAPRPGWRPEIEVFFLGVVVAMLLLVSPAMAQDGEAKIRMAHLSPDAPAVMVELDGEPVEALTDVSYRDATPYLDIPAGPHDVAVFAAADPSEPVLEVSIAPEAGQSYTVAGVGLLADETFGARLFEDDATKPGEGKAKVRVIHAVPDVGPATVSVADGPDLFSLPGFANASDYVGVDAGTYTLEVTPAGAPEPAFDVPDVAVEEGETYTVFAVGQASDGTLDTILTVDSDNGRVVGPRTLEDTSGDLSLLEEGQNAGGPEPRPESAAASGSELPAEQITTTESSKPNSAKKIEKPEKTPQPESPQPESPKPEEASVEAVETTYQAPVSEPIYASAAPVAAEPAEEISVPTVAEIAPETLVEPVVVDAAFVPQPVQTAVPAAAAPAAVPQVPAANAAANGVVNVVASSVATEDFVPPALPPLPVATAARNVSQQAVSGGGAATAIPATVDPVVGFISNTPAVVNSGARRKFVTIRGSRGRSLPDFE